MMAEKPRPASPATAAEQEGALAAPAPAAAVVEEKKLPANPEKAVEALEERLKDLGGPTSTPPAPTPAQSPAPAPTAKAAGGGKSKSALMARILAAQERAKAAEEKQKAFETEAAKTKDEVKEEAAAAQAMASDASAKHKTAADAEDSILRALSGKADAAGGPPPAPSLADLRKDKEAASQPPPPQFAVAEASMPPPPFEVAAAAMAPPPFEVASKGTGTPVAAAPPPSFAELEKGFGMKPLAPHEPEPDPALLVPVPPPAFPPAPSAPTFEQAPPPTFEQLEAATGGPAVPPEIDESMFEFDLDGNKLSPEERKKMIEEQRAIMAAIEREATLNQAAIAAARADNFEQRSASAAVRAISDGAPSASAAAAVGLTSEEATQLDLDHKLAEQLQKELNAEARAERRERREVEGGGQGEQGYMSSIRNMITGDQAASSSARPVVGPTGPQEKSWFDTVSDYVAPKDHSGQMSLSRPPGAGPASREQRGLMANVDGGHGASPPRAMMGMGGGRPAARVAESKPLFSCVVDSVSSAASAAADAATHAVYGDGEGNVHGVDSGSLLNVTQAGRDDGGGTYQQLPR